MNETKKESNDAEKSDNSDNYHIRVSTKLDNIDDTVTETNEKEELPKDDSQKNLVSSQCACSAFEETPTVNESTAKLREQLFRLQKSYQELKEISNKLSEGIEYKLKCPSSTKNDMSLRQTLNKLSEKLTESDNDVITVEVYKTRNRYEISDENSYKKKINNKHNAIVTSFKDQSSNESQTLINITEYSKTAPSDYPSWLAIIKSQNVSPTKQLFQIPSKLEEIQQNESSNLSAMPTTKMDNSLKKLLKIESNSKCFSNSETMPSSSKIVETLEEIVLKTNGVNESLISKDLQTNAIIQNNSPTVSYVPKPSKPFPEHITQCNYFQLDYPKIICDLKIGPTYLKLRIFQALRWRLTHASIDIRKRIIREYISNDIFGLMNNLNTKKSSSRFLTSFYFPHAHRTPHLIQQSIARLVNAVASFRGGRNYLTHDTSILQNVLLPIVMPSQRKRDFNFDTITKEMIVATLQKFSLRNTQRLCMISEGLVEHLIKTLNEKAKYYSMYRLEYTTALLMNLCLHKEAQYRCELVIPTVIEFMIQFLDSKYSPCLLYVNGTIYSLFMNQDIFNHAKKARIANLIKMRSKQCEGEVQQQLKFLYKFMTDSQFAKTKHVNEPNNNLEDEIDLIEPEIDMFDSLKNIYGPDVLVGEVLLHDRYFTEVSTPKINEVKFLPNENTKKKKGSNEKFVSQSNVKFITQSTSTQDLFNQKTVSVQVNYLIDNGGNSHFSESTNLTSLNQPLINKSPLIIDNKESDNLNLKNNNSSKLIILIDQQIQTDNSDSLIDQFTQTLSKDRNLSQNNCNEQKTFNVNENSRIDNANKIMETGIQLTVSPSTENKEQNNMDVNKQNENKHHNKNITEKDASYDTQINEIKYYKKNIDEGDIELNLSPNMNNNKNEKKNNSKNMIEKEIQNDYHINESNQSGKTVKDKDARFKLSSKFKSKNKLSPLLDHNNVSYNEQTKQFYKKPTKLAIFEHKKPHPSFTSSKSVTANRQPTSGSTTNNNKPFQTYQFYQNNSKSSYSESIMYNPRYAFDYYEEQYDQNKKDQCNCANSKIKPTESEMKQLNDCMNKDRRKFLPKLFENKPFQIHSEVKIPSSMSKEEKNNPYTHFSKNSCGNYSLFNFINIKAQIRKEIRRHKFITTTIGGSSSRRKTDALPKNPFKSRPKLPRTPPLISNGIF